MSRTAHNPDEHAEELLTGAGAEQGAAVFFDLDRTLMEGSSAFQFGRAAYKHGLLSRRQLLTDALANLKFRLRGSNDADTHALRDRISVALAGVRVLDMQRLGPDVLAGILPRVYPQMLKVAYAHQDEGRRVFIVTAAAQELANTLAHVLAFDGGIGSEFSEVQNGVYTGRPAGYFVYRAEKARAVADLAEREGIDLGASYAYSDSESDLPMLRAVGYPVAVNPDRELAAIAREEGWEILRFDRLSRRLQAVVGVLAATAAGGLGSAVVAARSPRRTLKRPVRRLLRRRTRRERALERTGLSRRVAR